MIHKNKRILIKRVGSIINEKFYDPNEPDDTLDGHLFKCLGKFNPSSLDHDTIAKEIHEHLHKYEYYSHSPSHPLILSPKEQKFKSEFKSQISRAPQARGRHELVHRDAAFSASGVVPPHQRTGRFNALWSTKGATKIYQDDGKTRIPEAERDGHITVADDSKIKHQASGVNDRWFARVGDIRRIPRQGLQIPDRGTLKTFSDINEYVKAKKPNKNKLRADVLDFAKNSKAPTSPLHHKREQILSWISQNHPDFHPDKLAKNTKQIS